MDLQKEREAFEKECRLLCYKGNMVMSNLGSFYDNEQTNLMWQMWLSAKGQLDKAQKDKDSERIDFLADTSQNVANVMLLTKIVERNVSSLRDAIDEAMALAAQEQNND